MVLPNGNATYKIVTKNRIWAIEKTLNSFIWNLYKGKKIRFHLYKSLRGYDSVSSRTYVQLNRAEFDRETNCPDSILKYITR